MVFPCTPHQQHLSCSLRPAAQRNAARLSAAAAVYTECVMLVMGTLAVSCGRFLLNTHVLPHGVPAASSPQC